MGVFTTINDGTAYYQNITYSGNGNTSRSITYTGNSNMSKTNRFVLMLSRQEKQKI